MPRLPRLTAKEAERLLLDAGFRLARIKGSHHIHSRGNEHITVPHHRGKILQPKMVKQIFGAISGTN